MKSNSEILDNVNEVFSTKNVLYKPASFWEESTKELIDIIKIEGIKDFRNDPLMSRFFVPKYGNPTNSFTEDDIQNIFSLVSEKGIKKQQLAISEMLSGYSHALSDYRVFIASNNDDVKPKLFGFSESNFGNPKEQFEFNNKKYSRSALNYLLGLSFLKKHLDKDDKIETVVEIGGGFGTLGEIFSYVPNSKYIGLDISPTSFVAHKYLESIYGEENITPYNKKFETIKIDTLPRCSVLHSWQIELLEGKIDLFVNFISFQEMEPNIVENYLEKISKLKPKWILLRNIREGKRIKKDDNSHGVITPIKTADYLAMLQENYTLIDQNVFPFGYKTVDGYHSELTLYKKKKQ